MTVSQHEHTCNQDPTHCDAHTIRAYFDFHFADKEKHHAITLASFAPTPLIVHAATIEEAVTHVEALVAARRQVYYCPNLTDRLLNAHQKGGADDITLLLALNIDIDIKDEKAHKQQHLPPSLEDARKVIRLSSLRPTSTNFSGHGIQGIYCLKEPVVLKTDEDRRRAQALSKRFQRYFRMKARSQYGWTIDSTANLDRVLRVPHTWNSKDAESPVLARVLEQTDFRIDYDTLEDLLNDWGVPEVDEDREEHRNRDAGDFPPANLELIEERCAFLAHCRDHAATLSEQWWYAQLSIIGRCENGAELAHERSAPYPRYTHEETRKKLKHALTAAGPRTCAGIQHELGFPGCQTCLYAEAGCITSPISLGVSESEEEAGTEAEEMETETETKAGADTTDAKPHEDSAQKEANGYTNGATPTDAFSGLRLKIRVGTDLTTMVNATEKALLRFFTPPLVYQRARRICGIARGGPSPKWLNRPPDAPSIIALDPAYVRELAATAAQWQKFDERAKKWKPSLPSKDVIAALYGRPSWSFPSLEGVIDAPTVRPDGSLLATQGYDAATGLYLDFRGVVFPPVPATPTVDEARRAIELLKAPFADFPFAQPHHRSAALAAVLSLVARYAVIGCVPLFAVSATTRGTGKGLLIDAIATIATGRRVPCWPQVLEEDEERKRLMAIGLAGDTVTHIDNVTVPLGSAPLDSVLTTRSIHDRVLGTADRREMPVDAVFFASGNNMTFRADTARRVVPIDLESLEENPEERAGFRHDPLLPWVQHFARLVRKYGDEELAVAAYNRGEGNVRVGESIDETLARADTAGFPETRRLVQQYRNFLAQTPQTEAGDRIPAEARPLMAKQETATQVPEPIGTAPVAALQYLLNRRKQEEEEASSPAAARPMIATQQEREHQQKMANGKTRHLGASLL